MSHFELSTSKRPNSHLRFGRNLDVDFCWYYWLLPTLRPSVQTSNKKKKIFKTFLFSLPHRGLCGSYIKKNIFAWTLGRLDATAKKRWKIRIFYVQNHFPNLDVDGRNLDVKDKNDENKQKHNKADRFFW